MGAIELLTQVVYLICVVVSARLWLQTRSRQATWSALTFGVLGAVVVVGFFLEEGETLAAPFDRILIVVVLLLPWLLFRFADSVVSANPWLRRALDVVGIGAALSVLAISELPVEGETPTAAQDLWVLVVVGGWGIQAVATTVLLWRGGTDQPGVTRGRVRMLAIGSLLLGLAITASAGPGSADTQQAISQMFSMSAAFTFLMGYAPPRLLRAAWRSADEQAMYRASVGLLSATGQASISDVMLPGVRALLGAPGIVVLKDGRPSSSDGDIVDLDDPGTSRVEVGPLHVAYGRSPSMPLFGAGEVDLLERLGLLASLAVERVHFVEAERAAKAEAEAASTALAAANLDLASVNEELEAFVYTTSHDLKNPVIAILGYLEVLVEDFGDALPEDARHYLDRMAVNATFMQSLIRDLLELSRVGRMDTEPAVVALDGVLESIANDAIQRHEGVNLQISWDADMPSVWVNPTRLRQLLENLVENAARYAGRPDVLVNVGCLRHPGGLRLDVTDNGVGIPTDQAERVFGMFERLNPEGSLGTGMGLAICRRIVESLGGTIFAMPSSEGGHLRIDLPPSAIAPSSQTSDHARITA